MVVKLEKVSWDGVKQDTLSDMITRQMVYGEKAMVARIFLKKGAVVPAHKHESEQLTWIISGALEFTIDGKKLTVIANEVLKIPSMVEHAAVALEDTYDVDIFSPIRLDWINGDDAYMRK
ncbi:MAG: cupin domain-containing protein [Methanomassiliicoccales archaeon]|nr:cupin domain-containing protein [Methanomassiliicoccales archaeon]